MNITSEILQKLKCSNCECYLSRTPIHIQENGETFCGRCKIPEEIKVFRVLPYENLLKMLSFPCMYQEDGCQEIIPFHKIKTHEEGCKYKKITCPVVPSGTCDWVGTYVTLYQHCNVKHCHRILKHPCVIKHDITKNSLETYITHIFGHLFLIHAKVCMTTHKIYHSVHYIGDVSNLTELKFRLEIQRDEEKVIKKGVIAPLGCKMIQENSSIACGINGLLEVFNGFDDTTFTIYILTQIKVGEKCEICSKNDKQLFGKYCASCAEKRRPCCKEQEGCQFIDIFIKAEKHENIFCSYKNWCVICRKHLLSMDNHYQVFHKDRIHNSNEYWAIDFNKIVDENYEFDFAIDTLEFGFCLGYIQKIFLKNEIGIFLTANKISEEISKYICVVKINTKFIENKLELKLILPFNINKKEDWSTSLPISCINGLTANSKETFISFDIRKKDNY